MAVYAIVFLGRRYNIMIRYCVNFWLCFIGYNILTDEQLIKVFSTMKLSSHRVIIIGT